MKKDTLTVRINPEVFDNIVILVTDRLNNCAETEFASRREYLGYVAELSEILDSMQVV